MFSKKGKKKGENGAVVASGEPNVPTPNNADFMTNKYGDIFMDDVSLDSKQSGETLDGLMKVLNENSTDKAEKFNKNNFLGSIFPLAVKNPKLPVDAESNAASGGKKPLTKRTILLIAILLFVVFAISLFGTAVATDEPEARAVFDFNTDSPTTMKPTGSPIPPTKAPTLMPSSPTSFPSVSPTKKPSLNPTTFPTKSPTKFVTITPTPPTTPSPTTVAPTSFPTTASPTKFPTVAPTNFPTTPSPTLFPTTSAPTLFPTNPPTQFPSKRPTSFPTKFPTRS